MSESIERDCGTMEVHRRLVRTSPEYAKTRRLVERSMLAFRRAPRLVRSVITIPVVVHVIYNRPEENVSDAQIESQMVVINQDFRARNSDRKNIPESFRKFLGDAKLAFKLAVRDPEGRPTSGITRTHTNVKIFDLDDAMKFNSSGGHDAWPCDRYLNMWVCDIKNRHGYAQFPTPSASDTDGIVIDYKSFGAVGTAKYPFHKGRTATHEIGHWLNLNHIWGDDGKGCERSDNVEDTPNQAGPNKGRNMKFPHISCNNGPHGDMFMNFMDYSDDDIMCMFSKGQCERMFATLDSWRASLQYSDALKKATQRTAVIRLAPRMDDRMRARQFVFDGVDWV